jgi:hypothetical protein
MSRSPRSASGPISRAPGGYCGFSRWDSAGEEKPVNNCASNPVAGIGATLWAGAAT